MKKIITLLMVLSVLCFTEIALAKRYGDQLCNTAGYHCIKVTKADSWESLWPDPEQRDIVKRINRLNIRLNTGMKIAVPNNLTNITIYDVSPFPRYINATGEKTIYVDQAQLAWGAYDANGELLWWGPISPGKSYCADIGEDCTTPSGEYHVFRKQGIDCVSTAFPKRPNGVNGGAIMPFCMHFNGGYALHGSEELPGYRASHGCVRLFIEDAKWLNQEFIELPDEHSQGTKVVITEPGESQTF